MSLRPEQVVAASSAWTWVPDDATGVETAEYLLVRFPAWFERELVVLRFEPSRDVDEVLGEVLAHAATTGLPELTWWVKLGGPAGMDERLAVLGELAETLDVLALDLGAGVPDVGAPDVETRWVTDVATLRASHTVLADVFGGRVPPDARLDLEATQTHLDHLAGRGGAVLALVDGVPVGTGGLSVVDGVARLWSGSVVASARGRGVYRALLGARLAYAVDQGCTLALVKGRVATSGPILRRLGFETFGQERAYTIALA